MTNNHFPELPLPPHFEPDRVGSVWQVPYQERAVQARLWAQEHALQPASEDGLKIGLLLVDVQNTFCIPASSCTLEGVEARS
jgi:hypothetical protein